MPFVIVRKSERVADRNRENSVHAPGTEHTQRTFEILLILKRVGEQRVVAGEFEILLFTVAARVAKNGLSIPGTVKPMVNVRLVLRPWASRLGV